MEYNFCPNCGEEDILNHYEENKDVTWNKRDWEEMAKLASGKKK